MQTAGLAALSWPATISNLLKDLLPDAPSISAAATMFPADVKNQEATIRLALIAQSLPSVPGGYSGERAILASPGERFRCGKYDHDHDHMLQIAPVSGQVACLTECDHSHDDVARVTCERQPMC